jgi:hypothetical protein
MMLLLAGMLFIGVSVAMFAVVGYANALVSGWRELARRYAVRKDDEPAAKATHQKVRFWPLNEYLNTTVGADDRGLFLRVRDLGHRPLRIPWRDIEPSGTVKPWFVTWETYRLSTGKVIGFPVNSPGARLVSAALERAAVEVRHR